jgi:nucleoside-diphosphate-sugar epimerase
MRVFVTGGTGAVGDHAAPALVGAGHSVTALARTAAKASAVSAYRATPTMVSLFDRAALTQAFAGHDAVVNLATALPATRQFVRRRAWRANDHVRIDGSAAVVDAALAAGVERLVQESVAMLYRDRGSAWVDEDVPVESYPIARANLAAEANAKRFTDGGRVGVVLRFGWFLGPGAAHSEQFLALARRHVCVAIGRADSFVSSIHLSDAAGAVVAALHAPAGTYNVVDDEPLTTRDYADALAAAAGTTAWLRLPGRAALLLGDRTTSLTRSLRVSNARLKAATGWSPRLPSAREGWAATAAALAHRPRTPQQAST